MIVCTECGRHNEDSDDFCGECGAFLEFSGERTAEAEPEPAIEDVEAEEAERPGLVERVKTAVLGEGAGAATDVETGDRPVPGETTAVATEGSGVAEAAEDDGAAEVRRRAEEEAQRRSAEAARQAEAARLAAEQAEREAEEEHRRAAEAEERRAREAAEAAEAAERAEAQARAEAEAREAAARAAEQEAAEARAREETEAAEAEAREEAEEERRAREAAARAEEERRAREAAARAEEEREARETAEREAAERAEAERRAREEVEAARRAAEERAKAAEQARQEAERQAQEAERAARMAALVAKPRPAEPTPAPPPEVPAGKAKAPGRAAPKQAEAAPADETEQPTAPTSRKPEAVKPQKQRQKRTPAPTSTAEVINPGDLICGSCGAGNDPERRFCRRCGTSLVEAAVMPKPPWYRRLFRRRPKAQAVAGTRPAAKQRKRSLKSRAQYAVSGTKSRIGKVGRILAILGVLGIAGLSLGPLRSQAGDLFDRVKRIISPEYEPVRPAEARASSELPEHPAMFAIDQIKNSYWAESAEGDGVGEGLTLVFPEPTDIDRIGFLNGASETPADFVTQPRIRELQLLFDDGTTQRLTLADEADFQQFGVEARDVTTVQLQILSVYPSLEGSAASLAEVELFREE